MSNQIFCCWFENLVFRTRKKGNYDELPCISLRNCLSISFLTWDIIPEKKNPPCLTAEDKRRFLGKFSIMSKFLLIYKSLILERKTFVYSFKISRVPY